MKRMQFYRPTTHYDERITQTDEKICELIKQRKQISNNNPGYPPFEYITNWAKKFDLYEDLLKSIFGSLWHDKIFKPVIEPKDFQKNLPVLKSVEIGSKLFSVTAIRQYSNSSIINFNIDWDSTSNSLKNQSQNNYELFINDKYDCRMLGGSGGDGHFHCDFIVSPPLPDNNSGIELNFKENNFQSADKQTGQNIIIRL